MPADSGIGSQYATPHWFSMTYNRPWLRPIYAEYICVASMWS